MEDTTTIPPPEFQPLSEVSAAYGDLVRDTLDGHFIGTFTTRYDVSPERAMAEFKKFTVDLTSRTDSPVRAFVVAEYTFAGRVHLHALIEADGLTVDGVRESWAWRSDRKYRQTVKALEKAERALPHIHGLSVSAQGGWLHSVETLRRAKKDMKRRRGIRGRAKVERFDPELGWAHYITKEMGPNGHVADYRFVEAGQRRRQAA